MSSFLQFLILAAGGALAGSAINWAIVSLGYFRRRPASPWSSRPPDAPPRRWYDRVPVLGWLTLRREEPVHGRWFWVRPLLIELFAAAFAVWFWDWQQRGGLSGLRVGPEAWQARLWFGAHSLLFALLAVATFIDFDEQTIPDWITVPGTVAGLLFAALAPGFRLPELVAAADGTLETRAVWFGSPVLELLPEWARGGWGLAAGLGTVAAWCLGLLPKIATLRWGWRRGLWLLWASACRCPRRTRCAIRQRQRGPHPLAWIILGLGLAVATGVVLVWWAGGERWTSLLSALLGMALGGGIIWIVRIIAGQALGQEAMGFGDVTLMGMIGAFAGWQAALLVFAAAPMAAVVIAVFQFALTCNRELAFGPYLALAAAVVVTGWGTVWNEWARFGVFQTPGLLLAAIGVSLVAMWGMLMGLQWMKGGGA